MILNKFRPEFKNAIDAILKTDIDYQKDNTKILVRAGTRVLVDLEKGIGLINNDHVMIDKEDLHLFS